MGFALGLLRTRGVVPKRLLFSSVTVAPEGVEFTRIAPELCDRIVAQELKRHISTPLRMYLMGQAKCLVGAD